MESSDPILHQRSRDIVVMFHDETENALDMVKVFEDWLLICAVSVPDDWKPIAGLDQLGTDQQAGDEAVNFFEQHRLLAKGKQCLVKLLDATRQAGHGHSSSMAAVREAVPAGGWQRGRTVSRLG